MHFLDFTKETIKHSRKHIIGVFVSECPNISVVQAIHRKHNQCIEYIKVRRLLTAEYHGANYQLTCFEINGDHVNGYHNISPKHLYNNIGTVRQRYAMMWITLHD